MNMKVTIELEVTPSNQAGLKDFITSLVNLSQGTSPANPISSEIADPMPGYPEPTTAVPEPTTAVPESPAKKTRTRSKKEALAPETNSPAPETNSPAPEPAVNPDPESRQGQPHLSTYDHLPEVNPKPRYTIEWVRNLLAEKVGKYRAECKQKLSELGAANVSSLDPEKYSDFVDFLNTLNV